MQNVKFFLLFLFGLLYYQSQAQSFQRYLCPKWFEDVTVTKDIVYGVNATVLYYAQVGVIPDTLKLDLYEPTGDTEPKRPLVLLFHSGSFLPQAFTGLATGDKEDHAMREIANKLAKRGFVVASCNYRLGWNPLAQAQDTLLGSIMNAAYRGIQDTRTAIRFFKHDADTDNDYRIDTTKIVVWGNGTGGFLSLGAATLDDYNSEIAACCPSESGKFYLGGNPVVHPSVNGNIYGTSDGFAPDSANTQLCYANWVGYSSDFQLAVNMGGAVPDISWVDSNSVPTISYHVKADQLTPCETGIVYSAFEIPIIEVSGSCDYQAAQNSLGNNYAWITANLTDPWTMHANGPDPNGFYAFVTDTVTNNAPWDFWSSGDTIADPTWPLDVESAKQTIDDALWYFAPRACITLGLGCDLSGEWWEQPCINDIDEVQEQKIDLRIAPNPAMNYVYFSTKEFPMQRIQIYDLTGRLVKEHADLNSFEFEMQRGNLVNGVYFAQVWFEDGFLSKQIIFHE